MIIISRLFVSVLFTCVIFWIYLQPGEAEPYVALFAMYWILFIVFADGYRAMPYLRIKALGLKKLQPKTVPVISFEIENTGDGNARNVQIETRVNMTRKTSKRETVSILLNSPNPIKKISKGKAMCENISLMIAELTANEVRMIETGQVLLSAYSIVRYEDECKKNNRELRTCSIYNPVTKFFEGTFCLCAGDDWPRIRVDQPILTSCMSS